MAANGDRDELVAQLLGVILPFTDNTTVEKAIGIIDKEFICDAKNFLNISVPPFSYPCIPTDRQCCSGHQGTSISLGIRYALLHSWIRFHFL